MATLAESFLADLDELSGSEDEEQRQEEEEENKDADMLQGDVDTLNYDNLDAVAQLASTERYKTIMKGVNEALEESAKREAEGGNKEEEEEAAAEEEEEGWSGPVEDNPTYRLLVACNALAVDIDNEIAVCHNFIRDRYRLRFPELESLVHNPVEYARVVRAIGNELDVTLVDLDSILPPAAIMVITVTATTTSGKPLSKEELDKVLGACDLLDQLVADRTSILALVQKKMHRIAPNLSEAVGTGIAAQLMGAAGGLLSLSKMPACNVQVLGAKRKNLAGFSTATVQRHQGFVFGSDIIQNTPPGMRNRAARLVGAKCTLLARVDAYGQDPSGASGRDMKTEMVKKIEKWQEPPPAKIIKPLPAPDAERKKRRGGRRYRKMKERYGITEIGKQANRMNFNQAEDEFIDGDEVIGLGLLNKEGSGRLRVAVRQQVQSLSSKSAKKYKQRGGYGGSASGLESSMALTPGAGFELVNPEASSMGTEMVDAKDGTESYFSAASGFRSLRRPG